VIHSDCDICYAHTTRSWPFRQNNEERAHHETADTTWTQAEVREEFFFLKKNQSQTDPGDRENISIVLTSSVVVCGVVWQPTKIAS
jgi:hypothetical protein